MSTFGELFKKAHGAIASLRGANNVFLGKDGEIVYSKNNVCVHETSETAVGELDDDENVVHTPGYLTIHCLNDEHLGISLVLQWLPNAQLEKNPSSIRCVSPRSRGKRTSGPDSNSAEASTTHRSRNSKSGPSSVEPIETITEPILAVNGTPVQIVPELMTNDRPQTLTDSGGLSVPAINVIPNTPVDPQRMLGDEIVPLQSTAARDSDSQSSGDTSGADEQSDKEEVVRSESSADESEEETKKFKAMNLETYRKSCATFISKTPEQFAQEHNLILDTSGKTDESTRLAMAKDRVLFQQKPTSQTSLFSVNLGKMRTMRLFFSNPECTSGQLVIASLDSQYKILHFHHGGLEKLAKIFEQWNAIKSKSVKDGSPSPVPDRQLLICHPEVQRSELDPEEGIYDQVNFEFWKMYQNEQGSHDDSFTIRKAIYFASIVPALRKEIWPFLLRVYPWDSTFEQRETQRNDLYLEYNSIKRKRIQRMSSTSKNSLLTVESTIWKDVVRTDRRNPYFAGENNPNLIVMKDILLNYAFLYPEIAYIQGMSDLLAPVLSTVRNESDAYWSFAGLMQQTLFCTTANAEEDQMQKNLEFLRELLKLLEPKFFNYLCSLGGDALQLMFVHRWLLLFFKREFPETDALHIWEACWARYRTSFFHLFVAVAIVSIYGPDVIAQGLPHDEILLYFSSLANHMDAETVLKKARGILHRFYHMRIPCTLAGVCDIDATSEQWSSHVALTFECTKVHGLNEPCPFAVEN